MNAKKLLLKQIETAGGPTDYDFIVTLNFTSTGTFNIGAYRGSAGDVVTLWDEVIYYRKKGTSSWTSLNASGQADITSVGEWEFGHDWNKSGNDCLTMAFTSITAINACTYFYMNPITLGSTIGNFFLNYFFRNCTNLVSMPSGFTIPSTVTTIGTYFMRSSFQGCTSLTSLSGFNFSSNITSAGVYFCPNTWENCTSLSSLPAGFTMPQGITSTSNNFMHRAFVSAGFTSLPAGFNFPQSITSAGSSSFRDMFLGCTNLSSLPSGCNLPPLLTTIGNDFLRRGFQGCTSLSSLPSGFDLPTGLTSVGSNLLRDCWSNCTNLNNDATTENLNFLTSRYASSNLFGGTCPITPDSASGPFPQTIAVNRT